MGTSLHGHRPCLIQCMARLSGRPLLCRAGKDILLFNGSVTCSRFSQALGQVLICTTGTRSENAQSAKKMIAVLEKRERSLAEEQRCLGRQRHWSRLAPAAGPGTSPRPPQSPRSVALQRGQDALVIAPSAQEEIKHGFFHFYQPLSVISFATVLPVGIYDYLTHICLHDDLAQIKDELRLGSRHLQAGNP